MQRVSSLLPSWDRRTSASSKASSVFGGWGGKLGSSLNRLSTQSTQPGNGKVGREVFWPATLDQECDRAARILKSFCSDGYMAPLNDEPAVDAAQPSTPSKIMKKIPQRIIQNAAGIAIFTCMRSGLWMTGSGGSGILIARKADGTWSPPAGIMLHTPTLSFIIGVDIYDCVLVVNDLAALESLVRPSVTLGDDVGLTAGPLVALDSTEVDIRWKSLGNTVLTYLKARGQSQTVNLNGCILTERSNENERFYDSKVGTMDIIAGNVAKNVEETRPIFEVIKQAEGRTDFDAAVIEKLSLQCAPGDAVIESPVSASPASPKSAFGIPDVADPDPFGVLALEMAGLEIREAGTQLRPSSNQFEYNPSPASPIFAHFQRQSVDAYLTRSNRGSVLSSKTTKTAASDACTQTETGNTPGTTPSPGQSEDGGGRTSFDAFGVARDPEEVDYTKIDLTPLRNISGTHSIGGTTVADSTESAYGESADEKHFGVKDIISEEPTPEPSPVAELPVEDDGDADDEDDEDDEEEPVIFEVAAAVQPVRTAVVTTQVVHAKGALVTIPRRVPPPLPTRSPARNSRVTQVEGSDVIAQSPLRQSFNEEELQAEVAGDDAPAETKAESEATQTDAPSGEEFADAEEFVDAHALTDAEPLTKTDSQATAEVTEVELPTSSPPPNPVSISTPVAVA